MEYVMTYGKCLLQTHKKMWLEWLKEEVRDDAEENF